MKKLAFQTKLIVKIFLVHYDKNQFYDKNLMFDTTSVFFLSKILKKKIIKDRNII